MHEVLGFERYGVHGSDIGAGECSLLAQAYPGAVVGVHLLDVADPPSYDPTGLTEEERAYLEAEKAWFDAERGYSHQQRTRPLTLAQGLSDSPSRLLAWILEKYRAWSDCGGDVSTRFDDDFLLTQASLYWFTDTISTSFRPYFERNHGFSPRVERVDVPTSVAVFPTGPGGRLPRNWVERTHNLTRYTVMPRGGISPPTRNRACSPTTSPPSSAPWPDVPPRAEHSEPSENATPRSRWRSAVQSYSSVEQRA